MTTMPITTGELVDAAWLNEVSLGRYRSTTSVVVVNTVTETDLLNGAITVEAGAMSTNRMIRVTACGDWVNNTGATQGSPRFKLYFGGVKAFDTGSAPSVWVSSASRMGWRIQAEIRNLSATNVQWSSIDLTGGGFFNAILATFGTSGQVYAAGGGGLIRAFGTVQTTVDTTVAQAVALTVTNPTASSSLDVTLRDAVIEIV